MCARFAVLTVFLAFSTVAAHAQGTVVGGPFTPGHAVVGGCPGNPPGQSTICVQDSGAAPTSITTFGASATAADNQTAIQAAINAAVAAGSSLYIPAASTCYKYTAPLTISGNLTIRGEAVQGNWNNGINAPLGTPPIVGSVLCPTSNGNNAITITGISQNVNISDLGILFQTPFTGTGDGINYIPTGTNQGLSGSLWRNVMIYGHDGNHYAVSLQNLTYNSFYYVSSFGGGTLNLFGNSTTGNFGSSVFDFLYGQIVVGGTANGVTLAASGVQRLNGLTFFRPQILIDNISGVSPGGNPPTSSQIIWSEDTNVHTIAKYAADLESNVGSPINFGVAAFNNSIGTDTMLFATSGVINAPSWTTNGILWGPQTRSPVNDTTATGTVALEALNAFPGGQISATNAGVTFTRAATLYLGAVSAGTNVTITSPLALYANGSAFVNGAVTSQQGAFLSGTTQINTNNGASATEVGDGTTSGAVTIGGASNTTNLNSATLTLTNLATDATHTDRTVCQDTTTKSIFFGSGAAGICLGTSSERYKHDIVPIDAGLNQLMALKPVQYKLNSDHGDPDKILYGFTAEQGESALPKLVGRDTENRPNTFDYLGVVPVLVKALQEQQAKISALEAEMHR